MPEQWPWPLLSTCPTQLFCVHVRELGVLSLRLWVWNSASKLRALLTREILPHERGRNAPFAFWSVHTSPKASKRVSIHSCCTCRWKDMSSQSGNGFENPHCGVWDHIMLWLRWPKGSAAGQEEMWSHPGWWGCSPRCTPARLGRIGPAAWQNFLLNILAGSVNLCGFCGWKLPIIYADYSPIYYVDGSGTL